MAKKKRKASTKKSPSKRTSSKKKKEGKETNSGPNYMIQVTDPKMLRKDLLESLREIIIFMQGYEKFRRIQQEKIATFTLLKMQTKELSRLIDHKLRKHFPRGKLVPITAEDLRREQEEQERIKSIPVEAPALIEEQTQEPERMRVREVPKSVPEEDTNDLDQLEDQLRDIENQLSGIQ